MKNRSIHIGQCKIPNRATEEDLERGLSLLPVAMHEEIKRYNLITDRLSRLVARLLVRQTLLECELMHDSTLQCWKKDVKGRPFLKDSCADISVSHAYPWVVSAVGVRCRVGIDIELYQQIEVNAFLPYLSAAEAAHISNSDNPEEETLHCWSRREAVLKADGRGLMVPEDTIRNITSSATSTGKDWHVKNLDFDKGCLYIASDISCLIERKEWDFKCLFDH